jgi:YD repeat-containing protein
MNKERTPALTYLSRHAIPGSVLAVDITVDSAINPATVVLIMTIPGKDTVSRSISWNSAWRGSTARRVVLPFDAKAKSITTGAYTYTLEARAISGGVTTNTASVSDTLVVVDRSASPFGVGWWLQGLELLSDNTPDTTAKLWVGGDGSTRLYRRQSDSVWTVTPTVDRPDTLRRLNNGGTITWRRSLGNNAYVEFDNSGQHIGTVNDLGHKTRFTYSSGAVDSIVLPVPSGSTSVLAYRFKYSTVNGTPMLDTVHAPKTVSMSHRRLVTVRGGRIINAFNATDWFHPYAPSTQDTLHFTVDTATGRISEVFRKVYWQSGKARSAIITWDSGNLATAVELYAVGTTSLCPVEGISLLSCVSTPVFSDSASTKIDGLRWDVGDTTRVWHTRFGGAQRVRDALGNVTTIYHENSSFPLLITKTVVPNGFTQRATFTSRGLLDSLIAVDPLGTSTNAVTRYTWHSVFNRVTQITGPTGDVTNFGYDSLGHLITQEDGRGSSTRTTFTLDAASRLQYVQPPGHTSGQRYQIEYDTLLGNVSKTTTPLGFATSIYRDVIGRVYSVYVPADTAAAGQFAFYNTGLDAWNRPTQTGIQTAKNCPYSSIWAYTFATIASTCSYPGDLVVTNAFDADGNLLGTMQQDWDNAGAGTVTHNYTYNAFGALVSESGGGQTKYQNYDAAGNVISQYVTGMDTTFMTYDALNRMITRRVKGATYTQTGGCDQISLTSDTGFPHLSMAPLYCQFKYPYFADLEVPADTAQFTYDAAGNVLTANNFDAQISRSYYPNGALKTDTLRTRTYTATGTPANDFAVHAYGLKYEYDLAGRRSRMQVPTNIGYGCTPGSTTDCWQGYHYLAHLGTVDSITSAIGLKYTFAYDSVGYLTSRTAPGGVVLDWQYDLDGRATRRLERRGVGILGSPVTVHLDTLLWDAAGKIRRASLNGEADAFQSVKVAYDFLGHVIASEFIRTASPVDTATQEFRYDAMSNLVSAARNRNLSAPVSTTDSIDSNGRLLWRRNDTSGSHYYLNDVGWSYKPEMRRSALEWAIQYYGPGATGKGSESEEWYGFDGRLRAFQRNGEDSTPETRFVFEEYRYDAFGRRVALRSQSRGTCSASFCKSAMERYVWDGRQLLAEIRVPGDSGKSDAALEADTSSVSAHYGRPRCQDSCRMADVMSAI